MNSFFVKAAAGLTAAALILGGASCGNKGTELADDGLSSERTVSADDMPYGSTLAELIPEYDENVKIMVDFDHRFFTEVDGKFPEIYKVVDYLYAIQSGDGQLMEQVIYPPYLDYVCQQNDYANADECVGVLNASYADLFGGEFAFTVVCISDSKDSSDPEAASAFEQADSHLNAIEEGLADKVQSRRLITIGDIEDIYYYTMYSCNGNSSNILTNALERPMQLCVYEIDGEYWVI